MPSQWFGDNFFDGIRSRLESNLNAAGDALVMDLKDSINTACPEFHVGSGGHSAPGSPPYRETGRLYNSVAHSPARRDETGIKLSAGSNQPHAKWLEEGTSKMRARPWLAPGLHNNEQKYASIIMR